MDLEKKLIILDPFQIYSYSNLKITLKKDISQTLFCWNNSNEAGITLDNNGNAYIISYNYSTNKLTQSTLMYPSIFNSEDKFLTTIQVIAGWSSILAVIALIVSPVYL